METQRHLEWERLRGLINEGKSLRSGIEGDPWLELLVEEGGNSIGLLIPYSGSSRKLLPKFEHVELNVRKIDDKAYLHASTSCKRLFQEFYSFLTGVADTIQLHHKPPLEAISERLEAWRRLFARLKRLSPEEETGLIGELWFLERLISIRGLPALESWTGPLGEPHDFGLSGLDIEVKTTRTAKRIHNIRGLSQLVPTGGKNLSLISVQLQPAGGGKGFSLPSLARVILIALDPDAPGRERFRNILKDRFGYTAEDSELYEETFILRTEAKIIPVDSSCPKILRTWIDTQVGSDTSARIVDVDYRIDVEGLGRELQQTDFLS
jgi:hypothetical protein